MNWDDSYLTRLEVQKSSNVYFVKLNSLEPCVPLMYLSRGDYEV